MVTQERKPLGARFVREVTRHGRYGDGFGGHGLSLLVKPTLSGRLSKTWSQRLRIAGREVMVGLGTYPAVTLQEARIKALDNWRTAQEGRHPRNRRAPTFAEAAERVIAQREGSWRSPATAKQWRSTLSRYAYPTFGDKPVTEVTRADIYNVLEEPWTQTSLVGRRLAERIGAVMGWAMGAGFRDDDPTTAALAALPKRSTKVEHRKALHHSEVAGALAAVRASDARPAVRLAFEFVALTASRSGEARGARWSEVDRDAALWTIPADRYKTGKDHRVPLSDMALAVLDEAEELRDEFDAAHGGLAETQRDEPEGRSDEPEKVRDSEPEGPHCDETEGSPAAGVHDGSEELHRDGLDCDESGHLDGLDEPEEPRVVDRLVFPASNGGLMPVNALGRVASRLGLATVHGLRTSFREWAAETGVLDPVAEAALGHVVGGVAGSYQRSDLFDLRCEVMDAWAQYIDPE